MSFGRPTQVAISLFHCITCFCFSAFLVFHPPPYSHSPSNHRPTFIHWLSLSRTEHIAFTFAPFSHAVALTVSCKHWRERENLDRPLRWPSDVEGPSPRHTTDLKNWSYPVSSCHSGSESFSRIRCSTRIRIIRTMDWREPCPHKWKLSMLDKLC